MKKSVVFLAGIFALIAFKANALEMKMSDVQNSFENRGYQFEPTGKEKRAMLAKSGAGALILAPNEKNQLKSIVYVLNTQANDTEIHNASGQLLEVFLPLSDNPEPIMTWITNCISLTSLDEEFKINDLTFKCSVMKHNLMFMAFQ